MSADIKVDLPANMLPGARTVDSAVAAADGSGAGPTANTSEKKLTLNLAKFGVMEGGLKEVTPELFDSYQQQLNTLAEQIRGFGRAGHKMTSEQQNFLKIFDADGTGKQMLQTESGWMLAQTMIEQENFLRLASLQKNIELFIKANPGAKVPTELTLEGMQGLVNKYGEKIKDNLDAVLSTTLTALFSSGALVAGKPGWALTYAGVGAGVSAFNEGISKIIESARKTGKIRLTDLNINTSGLPQEYQDYITYSASGIDERKTSSFLLGSAEAQLKFFEFLGTDAKTLNRLTPWEGGQLGEFGAAGEEGASTNVVTEWTRYRLQVYRELGGDAETDPQLKAQKFFEAQQRTIRYFIGQHTTEIAERKQGGVKGSLETMQAKADDLSKPEPIAARKRTKIAERDALIVKAGKTEEVLTVTIAEIDRLRRQHAIENARSGTLNGLIGEAKTRQTSLGTEKTTLETQRNTSDTTYDAQISTTTDQKLRGTLVKNKTDASQRISDLIRLKEESLRQVGQEIERLNSDKDKAAQFRAELNLLTSKKGKRPLLEKELKDLRAQIAILDKDIENGVSPTEKTAVDQLQTAIRALSRYGTVMSQLASAETNDLTVSQVADATPTAEFGRNYEKGYLLAVKLLFDYEKPPDGFKSSEDFFNKIVDPTDGILRPVDLANILIQSLDLTRPAVGAFPVLTEIFTEIKTRKTSQPELNMAFLDVLQAVEAKGLRIK